MCIKKGWTCPLWMHLRRKQQAVKLLLARWRSGAVVQLVSDIELIEERFKKWRKRRHQLKKVCECKAASVYEDLKAQTNTFAGVFNAERRPVFHHKWRNLLIAVEDGKEQLIKKTIQWYLLGRGPFNTWKDHLAWKGHNIKSISTLCLQCLIAWRELINRHTFVMSVIYEAKESIHRWAIGLECITWV